MQDNRFRITINVVDNNFTASNDALQLFTSEFFDVVYQGIEVHNKPPYSPFPPVASMAFQSIVSFR